MIYVAQYHEASSVAALQVIHCIWFSDFCATWLSFCAIEKLKLCVSCKSVFMWYKNYGNGHARLLLSHSDLVFDLIVVHICARELLESWLICVKLRRDLRYSLHECFCIHLCACMLKCVLLLLLFMCLCAFLCFVVQFSAANVQRKLWVRGGELIIYLPPYWYSHQ